MKVVGLILFLACTSIIAQPGAEIFRVGPPPRMNASYLPQPHAFDTTRSLESRARSYLANNCSYCHQPNAIERGGLDLRFSTPLQNTGLFNSSERPAPEGGVLRHVEPGNAKASEIFLRMSSLGSDGMPPLGRTKIDEPGLALIREWIESLAGDSLSFTVHYRKPQLEITETQLGLLHSMDPVFRVYHRKGEKVEGAFDSSQDNLKGKVWKLRFSQPLSPGWYWLEIELEGKRLIRNFVVL